jgi:hypothetical protein
MVPVPEKEELSCGGVENGAQSVMIVGASMMHMLPAVL